MTDDPKIAKEYAPLKVEASVLEGLRMIAARNRRSMASQIAWWVDQEITQPTPTPEPQP